jgi:hypothetical protein
MKDDSYKKLAVMMSVSFLIMYAVMFLNVDDPDHVYLSLTRTYMAILMVTPMAILMLILMPMMYKNKKLNAVIIIVCLVIFGLTLTFLRSQTFIKDTQFMKAMIPHHSSALLASQKAKLKDPEVRKLAQKIIESQEREIAEMKQHLIRLSNAQ